MPRTQWENPDILLTPGQVAEALNVGVDTVRRWAQDGKLSAVRTPGGHYRYRASEVEKLIAAAGDAA